MTCQCCGGKTQPGWVYVNHQGGVCWGCFSAEANVTPITSGESKP